MSKKRFINLLLLLFVCSVQAAAYDITGQVVDRTDGSELAGASVVVRRDSVSIVASAIADAQGRFAITGVAESDVLIDVQMLGYQGVRTAIMGDAGEDIELGAVALIPAEQMLDEVTVTGSGVIQKPDRYLVIPSAEEVERSSSSINLLGSLRMMMPGLDVNEALQTVTIDNATPVFQINGKQVSYNRILTINNDNVLRIEYRDTPDIRYADTGAPGVINFVLKPTPMGGSIMADVSSAVSAGFINAKVGGSYNYKKSEWVLSYTNSWRRYDHQVISTNSSYIGREKPIIRNKEGVPSEMGYLTNELSLGYTYMHDKNTMLSVTFDGRFDSNAFFDLYSNVTEYDGNDITRQYLMRNKRDSKSFNPSMDVYFRKQLTEKSQIEVDAFGALSDGDYDRLLSYDYSVGDVEDYWQTNATSNNSWRAGVEGQYSRTYSSFTTSYGVRYYHNEAKNDYRENSGVPTIYNLNTDYLYAYGSINGSLKNFGYSAGVGGIYNHSTGYSTTFDAFRPRVNIVLNYKFSPNWSINYLFRYDPSLPSLSQQTETVQTVDDITVSRGNLSLKPSVWFRNRIYVRYTYKKFYGEVWASHSRTVDPIYGNYSYISDRNSPYYGKFMSQTVNGDRIDHINWELDFGFQNLFNHLTIGTTVGWNKYDFVGFGNVGPQKNLFSLIFAQLYFGNFTISSYFEITPDYSVSGNGLNRSERFNYIFVQYKWKDWRFSCSVYNPFTKRGALYENKSFSDVHPERRTNYIKDNANMVSIGVAYRINFGKQLKKSSRTLRNRGVDTGVAY